MTAATHPFKPLPPCWGASVIYRDAATGQTWSGKGLQPKWLKVALARGKSLSDFLAKAEGKGKTEKVMVDAGCAGQARGAAPADLFFEAGA